MENDADDPGEENAITEPTARTGSAVSICGRRMYLWGGHTQIIEGTCTLFCICMIHVHVYTNYTPSHGKLCSCKICDPACINQSLTALLQCCVF